MNRRAFTLVELLVSITVLLVILGATARIFATASKVSGLGEANADLQTSSTAIERLIRSDIERLSRSGFMAIQCVAVRNDVNRQIYAAPTDTTIPLLDPSRAANEYLRCDQIVFFTDRQQPTAQYQPPGGAGNTGGNNNYGFGIRIAPAKGGTTQQQMTPESSSWSSMVRIGTGVQMPLMVTRTTDATGLPLNIPKYFPDPLSLKRVSGRNLVDGTPLTPWTWTKPVEGPQLEVSYFNVRADNDLKAFASQPEAARWTLARQSVLMADDGGERRDATGLARDGALYHHGQRAQDTVFGISMMMRPNSAPGIFQIGPSDRLSETPREVDQAAMLASTTYRFTTGDGDRGIFPDRWVLNSRVDIAACTLRDMRSLLEVVDRTGGDIAWLANDDPRRSKAVPAAGQVSEFPSLRERIASACFGGSGQGVVTQTNQGLWGFPRAERSPPSLSRADAMLSAGTLSGNCSSFQVDWTWRLGTGFVATREGTPATATVLVPDGNQGVRRFGDIPMPGLIVGRYPSINSPTAVGKPRGGGVNGVPATRSEDPLAENRTRRIPWFGLPDAIFPPSQRSSVTMLSGALPNDRARGFAEVSTSDPVFPTAVRVLDPAKQATLAAGVATASDTKAVAVVAPPIDVARIEGTQGLLRPLGNTVDVWVYQAVFGFNGSMPVNEEVRSSRDDAVGTREMRNDYTPWPSALRFTFTLHDPKLAMTTGRTFQFVVDLPNAPR